MAGLEASPTVDSIEQTLGTAIEKLETVLGEIS
jgi:hypothetical protein